ncbi:CaiB/BaiF CoA transferase family protein [Jatrophihabitans sp.]|uniref:CaiB/BaiF CoA transferase family protein n=1 Tax=Jatrophihabitans sp. TaxID=1932789 RepID=UPI002CC26579|nr:CaiB/BaiF CoA-transferase family protein [Jatrophihabitans sp.]
MADGGGPLSGVRVLELPAIGPVPFVGMLLADLGAEVTRIDRLSPGTDALTTILGPGGPLGRGRRSVCLDLRRPGAAEVALDLAAETDVLVEGFRPGVAERLGIGPVQALRRNPRLVYGRMTGWGQDGPLASTAGHDITYLALSGLLHGIGPAAGPPVPPANYVGDFGGGAMSLVVGLLAAVLSARSTGTGQVVCASMTDGAAYLATMVRTLHGHGQWRDEREANIFNGGAPNYRCYACSDGRYVAVGALEPKFWNILLGILGLDPATTPSPMNPDRAGELTALLAGVFAGRPRDEWAELFADTDACVAPVLTLAEAPDHPHNRARQAYAEVAGVPVAAPVPRFSATPATVAEEPPAIGADTEKVLGELGYSADRLAELRAAGVVG